MAKLLKINDLTKNYGKKHALQNINLSIPKGSCYGIVGPNGAGKTTLLKIIASILKETQGSVKFNQKAKIGYVPQEICLEQSLSAVSNLYFFGQLYGLKGQKLKQQTNKILKKIGLFNRRLDKVKDYSGGMKRRLNIGCALMSEPDLIILDEPTVGIDPQSRKFIFQLLNELREKSCTVIYASHYMEEVEQLCDQIAFFDNGEVIENGHVDEILNRHGRTTIYVQGKHLTVKELEHFGNVSNYQRGYVITGGNSFRILKEMLVLFENKPNHLERLELLQPRLVDVFMKLTGNELRDNVNEV